MPSKIASEISKRHRKLVRYLNDTYIFVEQSITFMEVQIADMGSSNDPNNYAYSVPTTESTSKSAYRTENEIAGIFERFVEYELFESFIGIMISRFESFLIACMSLVLQKFPRKWLSTCKV